MGGKITWSTREIRIKVIFKRENLRCVVSIWSLSQCQNPCRSRGCLCSPIWHPKPVAWFLAGQCKPVLTAAIPKNYTASRMLLFRGTRQTCRLPCPCLWLHLQRSKCQSDLTPRLQGEQGMGSAVVKKGVIYPAYAYVNLHTHITPSKESCK